MSLVGPHLPQLMALNFAAFVILAVAFVAASRLRASLRAGIDLLLIGLCAATLYAWNAMGRSNPHGLGTWALAVEGALIVLAAVHALTLARHAA